MLCLRRYPGERIIIGDDITVAVGKIEGQYVQLCIDAPQHINIRRSELPAILTVSAALADGKLSECETAMDLADNQIPAAPVAPEYRTTGAALRRIDEGFEKIAPKKGFAQ